MEGVKEYYRGNNLSISFEAKKDGYWLSIGDSNYFMDTRVYRDISRYKGLTLLDRLKSYNEMIYISLRDNKIFPPKLEEAFSVVKQIEDKELEEFKEANNL